MLHHSNSCHDVQSQYHCVLYPGMNCVGDMSGSADLTVGHLAALCIVATGNPATALSLYTRCFESRGLLQMQLLTSARAHGDAVAVSLMAIGLVCCGRCWREAGAAELCVHTVLVVPACCPGSFAQGCKAVRALLYYAVFRRMFVALLLSVLLHA